MVSLEKPDLLFGVGSKKEGFTTADMQMFNDLNPVAFVRELIQNSLDAAKEAGRKAIIRFELERVDMSRVPAIDTYRKSFAAVQKTWRKELADQARLVADTISGCLEQDKVETLFVLDNGIGLNQKSMDALLGEGVSAKSGAGSGAVGNGHLTTIPASDLRYVLYGGLNRNKKIVSGHAVLAAFEMGSEKMKSKDGYYALKINERINNPYDYPTLGRQIPLFVGKKLDWIKRNFASQSGTVVAIPGFNRLKEGDGNLWSVIRDAAACNFFLAISDGSLKVEYEAGGAKRALNKGNIGKAFQGELSEQKWARNFISGVNAAQAYETSVSGKEYLVDTGCGTVKIRVRDLPAGGKSRIDLCRNGMWITNKFPVGALDPAKFGDRKPFHCLINVRHSDGEIHKLIRQSEEPLHNSIKAIKWLKAPDKAKLRGAFNKIAAALDAQLEKLNEDNFSVEDFLTIMDASGAASGGRRTGRVGEFKPVPPRPPKSVNAGGKGNGGGGGGSNGGGGGGRNGGDFKRSGNLVPFGAVPVPTGPRSCEIEVIPQTDVKGDVQAEIRFVLDENVDETCDVTSDEQFVSLKNVKVRGKTASQSSLIKKDGAVLGVRLADFEAGKGFIIGFDYDLPADFSVKNTDNVALRAEIVRRRIQPQG